MFNEMRFLVFFQLLDSLASQVGDLISVQAFDLRIWKLI